MRLLQDPPVGDPRAGTGEVRVVRPQHDAVELLAGRGARAGTSTRGDR